MDNNGRFLTGVLDATLGLELIGSYSNEIVTLASAKRRRPPSHLRHYLRSNTGVYVVATTAGNQASSTTLAPGDVIISLNGQRILSLPELRDVVYGLTGGNPAVFEIERHEQFLYVERELEKQRREPSITDSGSTPRQEQ